MVGALLPPANSHLIGMMSDAGWMNGQAPLTATDLLNWAQACGEIVAPWEFEAMLEMSRHYAVGQRDKVAPFKPQQASANTLKAALLSMR